MKIFTIGHSVHTKETFIDMLKAAEIEQLADVRAFPASRKHPQFAKLALPIHTWSSWVAGESNPQVSGLH